MNPVNTKEYFFISKPTIGSIVKVYISKTECCFGKVIYYFYRKEIQNEYKSNDKIIPCCECTTECVMLKPVENIPFDNIDYFLDKNRVDFKIE